MKSKAFSLKSIHKKNNSRNFNGGHLPYFCALHFAGLPYLTEDNSVCNCDRTVKCLSNDSPIIAIYAEVLKYIVKFKIPETIILKFMIPNFFVQCNIKVNICKRL